MMITREEVLDLPFDQYQRYRITAEIVLILKRKVLTQPLKILDVGGCATDRDGKGYFLPLSLFLPEEDVTVVDVVEFQDPTYVKGDGRNLLFANRAFDVVICNDVLEHISPVDRKGFIENLIRTSRAYVVLAGPHKTQINERAESLLLNFITRRLGGVHQQLKEHVDFGLPQKEEVEAVLRASEVNFFPFPAGNIYRWFLMMVLKHYIMGLPESDQFHRKIDRFYNQYYWNEVGTQQAYRYFFIIFQPVSISRDVVQDIQEEILPYDWKEVETPGTEGGEMVFDSMLDLVWAYHSMIEDFVIRFHEATRQFDEIKKDYAQLQEFYRALDASPLYKSYRFFKKILGA